MMGGKFLNYTLICMVMF